jgi:3-methyladenine DNA glycosylase AlkC
MEQLPNIVKPKRSEGVPKETPERNSLEPIARTLSHAFPDATWGSVGAISRADYFAAGMQEQLRILARAVATDAAANAVTAHDVVRALGEADDEKVRAVAAFAVPVLFAAPNDQLKALRVTGAFAGTWPHEASAGIVHQIAFDLGANSVISHALDWITDDNEAVRRLATESLRPRLMMAPHLVDLKADPTPLRMLYEPLLDDPSMYVRNSVANGINDVSKDHPEAVLRWAGEWLSGSPSERTRKLLKRGLRTLVDEGNAEALGLLGYAGPEAFSARWHSDLPEVVHLNEKVRFEIDLANESDAPAAPVVTMRLEFPGRASAVRTSTYQMWRGTLAPSARRAISKTIHFADKSRQPLEPGKVGARVQVSGADALAGEFRFTRGT